MTNFLEVGEIIGTDSDSDNGSNGKGHVQKLTGFSWCYHDTLFFLGLALMLNKAWSCDKMTQEHEREREGSVWVDIC